MKGSPLINIHFLKIHTKRLIYLFFCMTIYSIISGCREQANEAVRTPKQIEDSTRIAEFMIKMAESYKMNDSARYLLEKRFEAAAEVLDSMADGNPDLQLKHEKTFDEIVSICTAASRLLKKDSLLDIDKLELNSSIEILESKIATIK